MKKLRVLALMHEDLVPPADSSGYTDEEIAPWKMEYDVTATLEILGHEVQSVGVSSDLKVLGDAILDWKPHLTFNLLEEFHSIPAYDQHVVGFLELMRQPYTGCNPRGLLLSRDKPLCKKILSYHRVPTPGFVVFPIGRAIRRPRRLEFPLLVKSATDHASLGITEESIVHSDDALVKRVRYVHETIGSDALVEEYIAGREFYVGVLGNTRLQTFPIWELRFDNLPEGFPNIATARVKWDSEHQKKLGISTDVARDLPPGVEQQVVRLCKRIYRVLNLSGYARLDFRLSEEGKLYVLEANPNPNLSYGEDFAESAETMGIDYPNLLQRIVRLGLNYTAPWRLSMAS